MSSIPTVSDLQRAKLNLDAYDDIINSGESTSITTPGGEEVDSVARAISTLKAFNFRGSWTISTAYALKDIVSDPADPTGPVYVRVIAGTSPGSNFTTEYAAGAGPWRIFQGVRSTVNTVAALRTTVAAYAGQSLQLLGYYAVGDCPERSVWWDSASTEADDGGIIFQVTGVPTGRWKASSVDPIDIRCYGAKLDNVTDDYNAWNTALNRALRIDTAFFNARFAGTIIFPDVGISYVSQTLQCKSVFTLLGSGTHIVNSASCVIRNPVDVGGIQVNSHNTLGTTTVANGSSAAGSVIDGVSFRGPGYGLPGGTGPGTIGRGIRSRAQIILRNVNVHGYAEEGIYIRAAAGAGGDLEGNCNCWSMHNVRSQNNGGHGVYVDGADANAGCGINVQASYNGGIGIYESSFLGNCWIQPLTELNVTQAYKADSAAPSTFLGVYEEGGQPASDWGSATLMVGGIFNYLDTQRTGTGISLIPFGGALRNVGGYESYQHDGAGKIVRSVLGGSPVNGDILYAEHELTAPGGWRLSFDNGFGANNGCLSFTYQNSVSNLPFLITGPTQTTFTFGRSAPVLYAMAFPKLMTAATNEGRQITHAGAAPVAGTWGRGDIVFNNLATAGGFAGWICTVAGSPGTWRTWGVIS